MRREALRHRVAELIAEATDGRVRVEDALAGDASLAALGLGSLGMLRLLDAVEDEFGAEIDLNRCRPPDSVNQLVDELTRGETRDDAAAVRLVPRGYPAPSPAEASA